MISRVAIAEPARRSLPQPLQLARLLAVGVLLEIIEPVDEHQVRRLADMVVDHVEHDGDAPAVERRHQRLQFAHAGGPAGSSA
jgi:hypothetical protein